ncbi:variant surface glycoprotein (VSG), putative [Trypanosoma brucei brucei TREU927]|uniref:Variant surface glycoprotein (VSG), putative n=1 Tax=Trypanosoma brucei brucei (strain 927/4 GUTat10.1) TaxID=185431 RepID=Q583L7_TRYB2|nr:variant surface glycoprotein (VSG), putative [Trypanosoma brucei brucei TREU927]AAX79078.1 variant surface glycoprotein (VSG), putative [Trypanosoma brucei]AAZ12075.1 variant surface glycoprotein (VSG), putative [Trypanosoma brucei brucei TREU927]
MNMLIIRFLALCILLRNANAAKNQHAVEFGALCNLFTLKDAADPPATEETSATFSELRTPIYNLNVSVADDDFLKDANGKYKDLMQGNDAAKLKAWQQHITEIINSKHGDENKQIYAKLTNKAQKASAQAIITQLIKQTDAIQEKYDAAQKTATESHAKAIEDILTAIYGDKDSKYTEGDFGGSRNSCGPTSNGNSAAGKNLLDDMICLCTNKAAATTTECGSATAPQVDGAGNTGQQAITHVISLCKSPAKPPALTGELIEARLAIFHSMLGRNPNGETGDEIRYVLGKYSASQCDGASEQNCVNYVAQLKTPGTGITWENKMRDAIEKLKAGQTASAALRHYRQQLKNLALTARNAYEAAKLATEGTTLPLPQTTPGVVEITETDTTCEKKGTGDECKPPCKVEGTGKDAKCKLNKEEAKKLEEKTEQKDGGDSKTTNTTGSNSFLIKTSLLTLAFLLF